MHRQKSPHRKPAIDPDNHSCWPASALLRKVWRGSACEYQADEQAGKFNESKLKVRKAIRKVSVVDALELRSPNEERGYVLVSREQ